MPTNIGDLLIPGTSADLSEASVSTSSTGDNSLVAADGTKRVRVYRIFLVTSAATTIKFKDGAGTDLTGYMTMGAGGGFTLDFQNIAWFRTSAGNAFILNQSGTAQISGRIYYQQT